MRGAKFYMKFKRNENETDLELIYRVCSNKDVIGTWEDVAVILNQLLYKDYTSSAYRKKFQSFKSMLEANSKLFTNVDNQLEELEIQRKLLQKERVKLRTEKLEYNNVAVIDAKLGSDIKVTQSYL